MNKTLKFTNGKELPLGTIYCIGKNYSKHAKEMGGSVPASPIIFIKPTSAYIESGSKIPIPKISNLLHHEVELVVVIGIESKGISKDEAHRIVAGYGVGIDLTLRDLQNEAKKAGEPWAVCKGFVNSAPLSQIIPAEQINSPNPFFDLELYVNGTLKQKCNTSEMVRNIGTLIEYISEIFTMQPGDCIFTGTPEGVGQLVAGDKVEAKMNNYLNLFIEII